MLAAQQLDVDEILAGIRAWIEIESPTDDPTGMARMAARVQADYEAIGVRVERIAGRDGFGDHLLVCPIGKEGARGRILYLPRGGWYDFFTEKRHQGGKEIWVDAPLEYIPVFVKEGAVLPHYPVQQYVGEKTIEKVTLEVYYKEGKEESLLFDDAHDGYDYTKGRYSLRTFKLNGKSNELIIQQHKEGKYITSYETFMLKFHGLPFKIKTVQLDNVEIPFSEIKLNGDNTMVIDKNFSQLHIIGDK